MMDAISGVFTKFCVAESTLTCRFEMADGRFVVVVFCVVAVESVLTSSIGTVSDGSVISTRPALHVPLVWPASGCQNGCDVGPGNAPFDGSLMKASGGGVAHVVVAACECPPTLL